MLSTKGQLRVLCSAAMPGFAGSANSHQIALKGKPVSIVTVSIDLANRALALYRANGSNAVQLRRPEAACGERRPAGRRADAFGTSRAFRQIIVNRLLASLIVPAFAALAQAAEPSAGGSKAGSAASGPASVATKTGNAIKRGAEKAEAVVKPAIRKGAAAVENAAKKTGAAVKRAAERSGAAISTSADRTKEGVKKGANKVGDAAKPRPAGD